MLKIEDYDFLNIFEKIGIEKYNDVEYLKNEVERLNKELKDKLNPSINKIIKAEIEDKRATLENLKRQREELIKNKFRIPSREYYEKLEKYDKKINALTNFIKGDFFFKGLNDELESINDSAESIDNISKYIHTIIKLKMGLNIVNQKWLNNKLEPEEKETRDWVTLAYNSFRTSDDVKKYTKNNLLILEYMDYKNRDVNSRVNTSCAANPKYAANSKYPEEILRYETEDGEIVTAYDIGEFGYKTFFKENKGYTNSFTGYTILSISRNDNNGNLRNYNGIMYLPENPQNDPEFYTKVVFSDINMRNAAKNNGYIGSINFDDASNSRKLVYNETGIDELMVAMAIANKNIFPGLYSLGNEIIRQKEKNKIKKPKSQGTPGDSSDERR